MSSEKEICEKIKEILFTYFLNDFEKIIYTAALTDNFYKNNERVFLKNKNIKYLSQYNTTLIENDFKIANLFKELRKIMQSKGQDWTKCYFYVTKDNKYYVDFVLNPYIAKDYKKSNKPSMIESFVNNFK